MEIGAFFSGRNGGGIPNNGFDIGNNGMTNQG